MAESPRLEVLKVCGTWGHGFVVDLDDLRGFFQPKQFYGDHGLALEGMCCFPGRRRTPDSPRAALASPGVLTTPLPPTSWGKPAMPSCVPAVLVSQPTQEQLGFPLVLLLFASPG